MVRRVTPKQPLSWPTTPVAHGPVVLREFSAADLPMVKEMSADPYVPLIGTLPPNASTQEALAYIDRQRGRPAEGIGFSFAIAEAGTGRGVGGIGLWLAGLDQGRATAGYSVRPSARGLGLAAAALTALTAFAWSIQDLHRIELYIEPWNTGSVRTAERAGFEREGLLRSHQEIGGRRRDMLLYATIRGDSSSSGPTIRPSGVLRTARLPGTSAVSAAGTPPTIAAPTSVGVNPIDADSGPATR
jgi:[ribosomal protein S5]-alanine N-acetyltransferase